MRPFTRDDAELEDKERLAAGVVVDGSAESVRGRQIHWHANKIGKLVLKVNMIENAIPAVRVELGYQIHIGAGRSGAAGIGAMQMQVAHAGRSQLEPMSAQDRQDGSLIHRSLAIIMAQSRGEPSLSAANS